MIVTRKAIPRAPSCGGSGDRRAAAARRDGAGVCRCSAWPLPRRRSASSTIYVGNGANMKTWTPPPRAPTIELTPMLEPLAAFRDRMLVI